LLLILLRATSGIHEDRGVDLVFEWDPAKDEANEHKHDISFTDAITDFDDPQHIVEDTTRPEHGETRSVVIGRVGHFVMAVIFTESQPAPANYFSTKGKTR
jgi:uncharacterized DUF497 family protein